MSRNEQILSLNHNHRNAGLNLLVISEEVCQQLSQLSTDGTQDLLILLLEHDMDA